MIIPLNWSKSQLQLKQWPFSKNPRQVETDPLQEQCPAREAPKRTVFTGVAVRKGRMTVSY